ncbi:prolyl oligopeptidase family serine peptidase [Kordia algicida OT-1]|uniref:Probable acylaminoacyl-peptidase n=1 Tax=Kordia algicida OT-1 TaxID=391587 RepID=A9E0S4_9FLAO|nr:prolyl oligopeptidase family serine peptidase [Kordia algicida]EDP95538.1 probable acylaminoacyl-peptidase [Kordia algicida OT-1]
MIQKILSVIFILTIGIAFAQKKPITHDDYDLWKSMSDVKVSKKGKIIASTIVTRTGRGDGYVHIYNTQTKDSTHYFNGSETAITDDEKFVIFRKKADYVTKRNEKKKKVKDKDKQKDVLYIYDVASNKIYDSITRIKSYKLSKRNSDYLVIEKFKNKKDSIKGDSLPAWKNNYALVYNLKTKGKDTIFNIKDFIIPEEGNTFYYTTKHPKRKKKAKGVFAYNVAANSKKVIDTLLYDYKKLRVNKQGNQLAYIAERDSVKTDSVPFKLFLYKENKLKLLVENEEKQFGKNQTLSEAKPPFFSEDGKRLYYYSKIKSQYKKDTTLLDDEIPQVDVWHWKDKITQPRQKATEKTNKEDTKQRYYDIDKDRHVQLQDDIIDFVYLFDKYASKYIVGIDNSPYATQTWKSPSEYDYYVIDRETGKKRLLIKKATSRVDISLDGKYGIYFDNTTNDWISYNLETLERYNMTQNIKVSFANEDNDIPAAARPYNSGGYDKEGNILFYDKYDIWAVSPNGKTKPKNITKKGRRKKITFRTRRVRDNFSLARYVNDELLLVGFDEKTKAHGIYLLDDKGKLTEKIAPKNHIIYLLQKAEEGTVEVFTKENFKTFEDLLVTTDNFNTYDKITDVNPHEKNFKWGTAELVSWKAYDGTKLKGIVHKPENFDPSKKYPMIVYFYERSSDGLHNHYSPQPSASTVNKIYAVSNDYIVFTPDIVYKTGQPGDDAYNCVISGVEMMEKKGYIDSNRMALQGQSWGGYQVAYLITKTNKFKAAMAGAPVSNMTSAYGGIRWGSGYSRMFQYEKTQSRIGKNLWDGFDLYVKNSPLFSLPNVETPLLIMHNDNDGAVPYYQGIELFMGMRRLQKPVWMLVYNNEAHNLRKVKNKQDLSIRMMQFFDHYLKDAPPPVWMTKGIPRREKGINFGYDLDKE